ncbi:hypothetical protein JCM1840_006068 [Sporobolomyces johnsonii]
MPLASHYTLNTGATLASVGLGCWMGTPVKAGASGNDETYEMVKTALGLGYTHFDTASGYGNEEAVGRAIRDSGKKRDELFVTTKLDQPDHGRVQEAFERSVKNLDIDYIDCFLMHWPQATDPATGETIPFDQSPTFVQTWLEMEKLLSSGKVKCIGVSNFSIKNLEILLPQAKIIPAINQVEGHPYLPNDVLAAYCKEKGIHLTAYSPIGQGRSPILLEPLLATLSDKYAKPAGSILLSWGVQRGWSVVPKSSNPERMAQNLDIFELEQADMDAISALHKQPGKYRSLCDYGPGSHKEGYCSGWRIKEDMGWDYPITRAEGGGWTA